MPLALTVAAATHGMAFGLWPICWIVFSAVLFYNLSVESGDFDVIRRSLARLTTDRRIQVLLVAFCFGALIEGIAGFGAPVAITASMLAGLGFEPIMAAVLALIANTAPVAFGSLGIPVTTLGGLLAPMLGHDTQTTTRALSAMVGRQLPFFSLIIPAYLVVLYAGWGRMMGVLPAVLVAGVTFAIGQFAVSNYVGPELTDTLAALFSLASVALLLEVLAARATRYADGTQRAGRDDARSASARVARLCDLRHPRRHRADRPESATSPACRRCSRRPTSRRCCAAARSAIACVPSRGSDRPAAAEPQAFRFPVWDFNWPGAYQMVDGKPTPLVQREAPVVAQTTPYALTYRLDFLAAAGTLVLIATLHRVHSDGRRRARGPASSASRSARPSRSCGCRS